MPNGRFPRFTCGEPDAKLEELLDRIRSLGGPDSAERSKRAAAHIAGNAS
jgi:hypothetical protein